MYVLFVIIFTFASLKVVDYFNLPYKNVISQVIIAVTVIYLIRLVFKDNK